MSPPSTGHGALGDHQDRRVVRLEALARRARRPRRCRTASPGSARRWRRPRCPACSAIQPAWRPITSTTSTRWWDSAVVCSRSIASIAMLTAVSKPKVKSVRVRSLSIVLGTPTTLTPRSCSLVATPRVSSPPIATRASTPRSARLSLICSTPPSTLNGLVREEPRIVPPRGQDPAHLLDAELAGEALERALPAVAEADELEAVLLDALADDGADDGVEPGAVAASGEDSDSHAISRAWAWGGRADWNDPCNRNAATVHPACLGPRVRTA